MTELDVVLLYDADCPNVEVARRNLLEAFARSEVRPRWNERLASDDGTPDAWRGFGSPTILIDGMDVAGELPATGGRSCRVYQDPTGERAGAPPVEMILSGLHRRSTPSANQHNRSGASRLAGIVPALGLGLLPVGLCPACWPVYAGLVSALGLGFLMEAQYLLPITGAALLLAVAALAFRARRRRGYGPFAVGLAASVLILVGKFVFASDPILYGSLATLVAASIWNSWPRPKTEATAPGCPRCATASAQPDPKATPC